jgi:hypothetical protein
MTGFRGSRQKRAGSSSAGKMDVHQEAFSKVLSAKGTISRHPAAMSLDLQGSLLSGSRLRRNWSKHAHLDA